MRKSIYQQIAELPEKEKRQLQACVNHSLGSLYERMKQKQDAKMRIELGEGNGRNKEKTENDS